MYPFHLLIFRNMLRNLARVAQAPVLDGPTPLPPASRPDGKDKTAGRE
jgi:hypothetical protein